MELLKGSAEKGSKQAQSILSSMNTAKPTIEK